MRLHVLLAAGEVRLAMPADRVRRVRADPAAGHSLAAALDRPAVPPAAALDVDGLPEALLVDRVLGVVDTSRAAPVRLPAASRGAGSIFDRAFVLDGEVYLELEPARLAAGIRPVGAVAEAVPAALPPVPAQALVFPVGERHYAAAFGVVLGVLEAPRLFPVPRSPASHRGVTVHAGALVSVLDLPAALGEPEGPAGRFAVLVDTDAGPVGLVATGPGRVTAGFAPGDAVEGVGRWLVGPAGESIFLPRHDRLPLQSAGRR